MSDEGPRCGSPVHDPGPDREAVDHAVPLLRHNRVIVAPIVVTLDGFPPPGPDSAVVALAQDLAARAAPGGQVFISDEADLAGKLADLVRNACRLVHDCDTNGILNECEIAAGRRFPCTGRIWPLLRLTWPLSGTRWEKNEQNG